jgi:hypothetical protein
VTRDEATAEVRRRRGADPASAWIAAKRADGWVVVRLGMAPPIQQVATATQPPPVAPRDDPYSPLQRAIWTVGGGV